MIDFGKYKVNQSIYDFQYSDIRQFFIELQSKDYAYNVSNLIENESILGFTYYYHDGICYHVLYFKSNQELLQIKAWKYEFYNGLKRLSTPENWPLYLYKNDFYGYLESYDLIYTLDSIRNNLSKEKWGVFAKKNQQLIDLYYASKLDDNPLVIVYNLK